MTAKNVKGHTKMILLVGGYTFQQVMSGHGSERSSGCWTSTSPSLWPYDGGLRRDTYMSFARGDRAWAPKYGSSLSPITNSDLSAMVINFQTE